MRTFLLILSISIAVTPMRGDPPEEDILRPRIATHGKFFVSAGVGLNTTWFDGNPIYRAFFPTEEESRMFRSAFGFEPMGQVSLGMSITPKIRVRVQGAYDVRVAERNGSTVDTCTILDAQTRQVIASIPTLVEKEFRLEISYVTIALLGEYSIGPMFIFLGPSWSQPIKRSFSETDRIVDPNSVGVYFSATPDSTRQIRAEVNGIDNVSSVLNISLGLGYSIRMTDALSLVPQIGFDFPFGTALKADEDYTFQRDPNPSGASLVTRLNRHMYFRALQASVALRYSF